MWVGIKEEVAPPRTDSSLLRTQNFGCMENEPLCVVVFPFIILLYLHRLALLLEKALWLAKISTPPFVEKCLTKLFRTEYTKHNEQGSRAAVSHNERLCLARVRSTGVRSFT